MRRSRTAARINTAAPTPATIINSGWPKSQPITAMIGTAMAMAAPDRVSRMASTGDGRDPEQFLDGLGRGRPVELRFG